MEDAILKDLKYNKGWSFAEKTSIAGHPVLIGWVEKAQNEVLVILPNTEEDETDILTIWKNLKSIITAFPSDPNIASHIRNDASTLKLSTFMAIVSSDGSINYYSIEPTSIIRSGLPMRNEPKNVSPIIKVDVILDFICPKCYEGVKSLRDVISASNYSISVEYHSYFLNEEDIIMEGLEGSRIERAMSSKSSLNAHRLLAFAQQQNPSGSTNLVLSILAAFCKDGKDISDKELLADIASHDGGLDRSKTKKFLDIDDLATQDVMEEAEMNAGRQGAPLFIVSFPQDPKRRLVFGGVQDPSIFSEAFDNISK